MPTASEAELIAAATLDDRLHTAAIDNFTALLDAALKRADNDEESRKDAASLQAAYETLSRTAEKQLGRITRAERDAAVVTMIMSEHAAVYEHNRSLFADLLALTLQTAREGNAYQARRDALVSVFTSQNQTVLSLSNRLRQMDAAANS